MKNAHNLFDHKVTYGTIQYLLDTCKLYLLHFFWSRLYKIIKLLRSIFKSSGCIILPLAERKFHWMESIGIGFMG